MMKSKTWLAPVAITSLIYSLMSVFMSYNKHSVIKCLCHVAAAKYYLEKETYATKGLVTMATWYKI